MSKNKDFEELEVLLHDKHPSEVLILLGNFLNGDQVHEFLEFAKEELELY